MTKARSILSVALAFLVLVSATSFMVGMHVCMGEIQNVALFAKAEGCEKEKQLPPCHRHETLPCCDDEILTHEGQDVNTTFAKLEIAPLQFVLIELPPVLISEVVPSAPLSQSEFYNYDPPFRASDRVVTLQSFLI